MLKYHGTPITPVGELKKLSGRNFCVSYARRDQIKWCIENGQSVMLDNGAFSAFTQNKSFDMVGYYNWVECNLAPPHWAVIPDVIGGSVDDQRELLKKWPFPKELSAPVWHMHLPLEYLVELSLTWPRVCIGSSGQYWKIGTPDWKDRISRAWDSLSIHTYVPHIHMLRAMRAATTGPWPFASTDSTNIGRNFKNKIPWKCPMVMADRIESMNPS